MFLPDFLAFIVYTCIFHNFVYLFLIVLCLFKKVKPSIEIRYFYPVYGLFLSFRDIIILLNYKNSLKKECEKECKSELELKEEQVFNFIVGKYKVFTNRVFNDYDLFSTKIAKLASFTRSAQDKIYYDLLYSLSMSCEKYDSYKKYNDIVDLYSSMIDMLLACQSVKLTHEIISEITFAIEEYIETMNTVIKRNEEIEQREREISEKADLKIILPRIESIRSELKMIQSLYNNKL